MPSFTPLDVFGVKKFDPIFIMQFAWPTTGLFDWKDFFCTTRLVQRL